MKFVTLIFVGALVMFVALAESCQIHETGAFSDPSPHTSELLGFIF